MATTISKANERILVRRRRRPDAIPYTTAYNDLGQVALIGDGATEYAYTYGLFGNLTSTTQDLSGLTPDVKFAYRYDSSGRLAEVAASIGPVADYVTTYRYDRIGRITRIEQDDAGGKPVAEKRVDFDYDAAGDLKEIKRYAELAAANLVARTDYVFDAIGRLTDLAHARNQITLADYDLTWDAAGRITDFDFTSLIGNAARRGVRIRQHRSTHRADYDFQTDESYPTMKTATGRTPATRPAITTGSVPTARTITPTTARETSPRRRRSATARVSSTPGTTAIGSRRSRSRTPAARRPR